MTFFFALSLSLNCIGQESEKPEKTKLKPTKTESSAKKPAPKTKPDQLTVEQVARLTKPSIVVVTITGRDGKQQGLGTGFVVSKDGLIATNLHVIGEGRPISVQFYDGKKFDVIEVHATDRVMDLAVIRIDKKDLKPLELGDSDKLKEGQSVVAVGNPLGFEFSVVEGVVSQKRTVEGKPMIQVAIPIERGNSGGPLMDRQGRVHGLLTLKSQVTENLGFAIVVNALKPLIEKPNPIPMSRWITIGTLNERDWKTKFGAKWRQRSGRIVVESLGNGFGGRSICLSQKKTPKLPYEIVVKVKMSPESGAAGLIFHADGNHKHYGFYPSNGQLRLTRFSGSSVYTWKVLADIPHAAYRADDWNTLKVRVAKDGIKCFINDQLAIESSDTVFTSGQVGLAKFRETEAQFKDFQIAKSIGPTEPSSETLARITKLLEKLPEAGPAQRALVFKLAPESDQAADILRREAKALEEKAKRIRELAVAVHARRVQEELKKAVQVEDKPIDLMRVALLIARLDNDEVNVDGYLAQIDRMARDIETGLPKSASESARLEALNKHLFKELGFHGSRSNYYSRSNSYMNETIDDREGLPITMSVLYIELARRLKLNVVGVGLPGHFVVRHEPKTGDKQLIDVFDQGRVMSDDEALGIIRSRLRGEMKPEEIKEIADQFLEASTPKAIVTRMLTNLRGMAERERDLDSTLRYVSTILVIDEENLEARSARIDLSIRSNRLNEAISDIDWMLEKKPAGMDVNAVLRLRRSLESRLSR
jgi:regulator of sirC expression with transglutaminase-like and TPR domain